ncbi:hypothetical protein ACFQZX_03125 [Mucilaginibacter litoreus]|uniref:Uncharacterized protein n=1 Tax=Mucilaginibacter litoreus TaxID=1048221 RepID=A0ABW3ANQ0_9SPHI
MKKVILYLLAVYDIYLYLPDIFDWLKVDIEPPTSDYLLYFDAAMLLVGGIFIGWLLTKQTGTFNKMFGIVLIILNIILTPLFIWKALP